MKVIQAKIVVIGPYAVGKTSIVSRYQSKSTSAKLNPSCTVGASFSQIEIVKENYKVKMQVWDTAGQERFRAMAPMYYRGANGAILVYDVTSISSFEDIKEWANELLSFVDPSTLSLVICANKCDLLTDRKVSERQGREFSKEIDAQYFETSALEGYGVTDAFEHFASNAVNSDGENCAKRDTSTVSEISDLNLSSSSTDMPRKSRCCK